MTRLVTAVVIALVAVLAGVSLVLHDSFYVAMKVRPEDAGASELDIVVRGVIYLGLPVAAAAIAAGGIFVLAMARGIGATREGRSRLKTVAAVVVTVALAGAVAAGLAAVMAPGARDFARESSLRLVGALVVVLAFATVMALLIGFLRRGKPVTLAAGWLALAIMATAAVPALMLAHSAGESLAERARAGMVLQPGALDPLQLRAEPACILPRTATETLAAARLYVLLGEASGGAVLYDAGGRRSFTLPADRLGVLGRSQDVCRVPGEPVPIEAGTPTEDAALAKRFRPVLRFDSREPWRPLNVERFVAETFPDPPTRHLICPERGECAPIGSTADFAGGAIRLDVRGRRSDGADHSAPAGAGCPRDTVLLDCENDGSAMYYFVTRQDRRVFVDYWWFLRYNHFPLPLGPRGPCGGRPTPKSQHEGDWEGVTVVTKFGKPEELDYVVYSAHGHGFRYRGIAAKPNERPTVFVACGSHASYPRGCAATRGCRQTSACRPNPCRQEASDIAEAPADGARRWHRNDDAECFDARKSACLLPFPAQPATAEQATLPAEWTAWAGRWGNARGPRSPARQGRFIDPWDVILTERTNFGRMPPGEPPANG